MTDYTGIRRPPPPVNEPIRSYAPGSPERASLKERLKQMASERVDIPVVVGGKEIRTGETSNVVMPHAHGHVLATMHKATRKDVEAAVVAARRAWKEWAAWPWEHRAAVLLKAAELLTTTQRNTLLAATMLGQSKTVYQAEIDAACGTDRLLPLQRRVRRRALRRAADLDHTMWNATDYRPLEGFVFAVTPFNFTAIGGNLTVVPGADGLRRALEAGVDRDPLLVVHVQRCSRKPGCRPA